MTSVTPLGKEFQLELVVARREEVADDVICLHLTEATGHSLPEWQPGAHVDLILAPGVVRQYSLCGDPKDSGTWRVAILREASGRGGSIAAHQDLHPGRRVVARGPRNQFPLEPARTYRFVAGGIGITPLLPMIAEAERTGTLWQLLYGGRRRSSMAFVEELSQYGDKVLIRPQGECGLLDLTGFLGEIETGTLVYCCGPEALLSAVEQECENRLGMLRVERFAPKPAQIYPPNTSFEVFCTVSDLRVTVPADRSILDVVTEAGVDVLSSCAEGTCGTCETRVLEGRPDQRDSLLSDEDREAGDFMMICVSRSQTARLVLEL